MGHQADPAHCYKLSFPTQIAVHLTKHIYIVFVTGEDDIARFNPRRYNFLEQLFGNVEDKYTQNGSKIEKSFTNML